MSPLLTSLLLVVGLGAFGWTLSRRLARLREAGADEAVRVLDVAEIAAVALVREEPAR